MSANLTLQTGHAYNTLFGPKVDQALLVVNPNERLDAQGAPCVKNVGSLTVRPERLRIQKERSLLTIHFQGRAVKLWGCNLIL